MIKHNHTYLGRYQWSNWTKVGVSKTVSSTSSISGLVFDHFMYKTLSLGVDSDCCDQ